MEEAGKITVGMGRKKDEKKKLVDPCNNIMTTEDLAKYRLWTLIVSWISVISLFILGTTTLVVAILANSSASFAFALDALLDCMSSIVVIWRYTGTKSLYSHQREKRACITLGVLFIISAVTVSARSIASIVLMDTSEQVDIIWYLAIVNFSTSLLLCVAKIFLAKKLHSISIATDAVNSGIGATLAFSTFISSIVYEAHPSAWFMDPTVGLICSTALVVYGIWIIIYEVKYSHTSESQEPGEYTELDEK